MFLYKKHGEEQRVETSFRPQANGMISGRSPAGHLALARLLLRQALKSVCGAYVGFKLRVQAILTELRAEIPQSGRTRP